MAATLQADRAIRTLSALSRLDEQPNLTAGERDAANKVIRLLLYESELDPDTERQVTIWKIAQALGGHWSTVKDGYGGYEHRPSNGPRVGRLLQRLDNLGIIHYRTDAHDKTTSCYLRGGAFLEAADQAEVVKLKQWGGYRPRCPKCDSEDVERVYRCLNPACGHVWGEDDSDDEPPNGDPWPDEPPVQLEPDDLPVEKGTVNSPVVQPESAPVQLEPEADPESHDARPDGPVQVEPEAPATGDWLGAAAAVLLTVAGDELDHAELQPPSKPNKYLTIAGPLTLARCRDHLRGRYCYATRIRGERTRAVVLEVDDARGRGVLLASSEVLALNGAKPMVWASPSLEHAGGAALWLVFDQLVDASAALATIYHYAPALEMVREVWPGRASHIRLPGGRYSRVEGRPAVRALQIDGKPIAAGPATWQHIATSITPATWLRAGVVSSTPPNGARVVAASTPRLQVVPRRSDFAARAAAFAERCPVASWLDFDRSGWAKASWRSEKVASVKLQRDGAGWFDHGEKIGGDALDLAVKVTGRRAIDLLNEALDEVAA